MILAKRDGRTVYHWPKSLEALIKARDNAKGKEHYRADTVIYEMMKEEAMNAANKWQMCACGALCSAIPRHRSEHATCYGKPDYIDVLPSRGRPQDSRLKILGRDFYKAIKHEDYEGAQSTLLAIEVRAGQILREMGKTKKRYGKPILNK